MSSPARPEQRTVSWRTEYFVFCCYCHVSLTQSQVAGLFGIKSPSIVSDIVYAWANILNDALKTMFPTPTRSQLLRAYPLRFIRAFGDARAFLLLDATELRAQDADQNLAHGVLHSDYKGTTTLKSLAGCGPIGETFDESVPEHGVIGGGGGDTAATEATGILECVPFGMAVEVDKGFLIDNICALLGIGIHRPPKKMKGQTQQSAEDTALTQKIGNTRIVIEQVNGGAKATGGFFKGVIPILQLGLAPLLIRICFFMQNFSPAFIHGVTIKDNVDVEAGVSYADAREGRPSRAEIRWYGGTDDGLLDVRGKPELWATKQEHQRFNDLRKANADATTDIEIGEMVLKEDWPTRLRQKHRAALGL